MGNDFLKIKCASLTGSLYLSHEQISIYCQFGVFAFEYGICDFSTFNFKIPDVNSYKDKIRKKNYMHKSAVYFC